QYVHQGVFQRQLPLKARIIIYLVTAGMIAIPFFKTDLVWLKIVLPLTSLTQIVSMESYYRGYLWRDGIPFMKNNNK
ncbi:MAG: YbaN family protein, partial [Leuconostoc falkenbergense]